MGAAAADPLGSLAQALSHLHEVRFDAPERAWLAIPALAVLVVAPFLRRGSRRTAIVPSLLRAALLGTVLAVLCEPYFLERGEREGAVVVLADTSPSVGARGLEQLRGWLPGREVVAFGSEPRVVTSIDADPAPVTDIAAALRLGAVRAGVAHPLRLLLFTDGRATRGDADALARALRRRDVEIVTVGVPDRAPPAPPSFRVPALRASEVEEPGRVPTLMATVAADAATTAEARLYLDGREIARRPVSLAAGTHELPWPGLDLAPGTYHAQVFLAGDRTPDDNAAATTLRVEGAPRVLCLAQGERRSLVADALRAQGMEVTVAGADASLEGFDAVVVLPDADARVLDTRTGDLAAFLGRGGGGLLAIGGTEGPGLARFADAPLAYLLPVDVPARREAPDEPKPPANRDDPTPKIEIKEEKTQAYPITLCLVVDRSGSMRGPKMEKAKVAAAAAAQALTNKDRIAVIAFGDEARLVLPPRSGGHGDSVLRILAPLPAEGRTAMYAALSEAYALMDKEGTPIRHIILVSDGEATDTGRWRDLVLAGQAKKITLSCVGIGFDVDRRHLGRLATWGHGKVWSVVHAQEIPQVVTQDTMRVVQVRDERGKDAERAAPERKEPEPDPDRKPEPRDDTPAAPEPAKGAVVRLEASAPRAMFKGIPADELPEVGGVEAGEPRFASWVAARAGESTLVAYRRVGLGTSAALLADPESRGGRTLREHPEFARMMAQLVRSVLPDRPAATVQIVTRLADRGARLQVEVYGEDGRPRTDLPLALRVGDEAVATVRRSDRYEAELPFRPEVEVAHLRVGEAAAVLAERTFVVPPSRDPEMGAAGIDSDALRRLAGGPPAPAAGDAIAAALRPPVAATTDRRALGLPFLLLAAILLPLDAWARRRARSGSPSRRATRTASGRR